MPGRGFRIQGRTAPAAYAMAGNSHTSADGVGLTLTGRPARSDRAYGAVLLGCLAFILVSLGLRVPVVGYSASAMVTVADARGGSTERLSRWLATPRNQESLREW